MVKYPLPITLCLTLMFSFASDARDANAGVPAALTKDERSEARSLHTRQGADALLDLLKHRNHARIVTLEPGDVGVDFETKDAFRD